MVRLTNANPQDREVLAARSLPPTMGAEQMRRTMVKRKVWMQLTVCQIGVGESECGAGEALHSDIHKLVMLARRD